MKIEKVTITGLSEIYKYIDSIKNTDFAKSTFRNHLGNLYYSVNIHLSIKDMNILELIYAKKMYDDNIIIGSIKENNDPDDDDYKELLSNIKNRSKEEMPLFYYTSDAYVSITGPLALGVLSTERSYDPVAFLYEVTKGACFTKDGTLLPNISKYNKDIEEKIKVNFVNSLYSYMYKMIFDGDLLSDYAIDQMLFTSNDGVKIESIDTYDDITEVNDRDILENFLKKITEYASISDIHSKNIQDITFVNFSVKGTIEDLFKIYKVLPIKCITNVTPFMVMINKDNMRIQDSEDDFDKLVLSKYETNLLRRTVCLPKNTICDFTLRISFTEALSYLSLKNRKDDSDIINYIYNIINSFWGMIESKLYL